MSGNFDLLIKNGTIVDGSGNPGYKSDLGVTQGRIEAIEKDIPVESAKQTVDASGSVVAPGFIDAHTHDDFLFLVRPDVEEKSRQGVTTLVTGNCGIALAPLGGDKDMFIKGMLGGFGGNELGDRHNSINDFDDYLKMIEDVGPGVNAAPLLGHVNLRFAVLGMENRPPSDAEMDQMKQLTAKAMEQGALGLSTGLIYAPGNYASTEEIIELAKTASEFGGIYTTHLRSEGNDIIPAMNEALRIGEEAGIHVHISHHKLAGRPNWGRSVETLNLMTSARAKGMGVTCDQYPYPAGSTYLAAALPPKYLAQGADVLKEKLTDPKVRKEIIDELEGDSDGSWENLIKGAGFDNIIISFTQKNQDLLGKSLAVIAEEQGKDPYEAMFDILAEEATGAGMIIFTMCDEDIERIMQSPYTMIGSDGIPGFGQNKTHPRMTGTFPRVLGEYVRNKKVLKLEEAIWKMTSLPAKTFGLANKGLLVKGYDADIVVFDPDLVKDESTYDLPDKSPSGISLVAVNGSITVENGQLTGARAGKVLRRT